MPAETLPVLCIKGPPGSSSTNAHHLPHGVSRASRLASSTIHALVPALPLLSLHLQFSFCGGKHITLPYAPLRPQGSSLTRQLLLSLLPPDPRASRPALLEVRAGAGGEEATLFAAELLAMYERYAQVRHVVMSYG